MLGSWRNRRKSVWLDHSRKRTESANNPQHYNNPQVVGCYKDLILIMIRGHWEVLSKGLTWHDLDSAVPLPDVWRADSSGHGEEAVHVQKGKSTIGKDHLTRTVVTVRVVKIDGFLGLPYSARQLAGFANWTGWKEQSGEMGEGSDRCSVWCECGSA